MTLLPLLLRFWVVGGVESGGRERSPGQAEKTAVKSINDTQVRLVMILCWIVYAPGGSRG